MRASEFLADLVRRLESVDLEYGWYYQQGASDKHLRDIASMLRISPQEIDLERIRRMADEEAGPILDRLLEAVEED